jgi:hypothetical protein
MKSYSGHIQFPSEKLANITLLAYPVIETVPPKLCVHQVDLGIQSTVDTFF